MARSIAFLRAINVGGHVVKMGRLQRIFSDLGLTNVETFIASGNVIFESRASAQTLEAKIARQLQKTLGYEVATFVRSTAEVATIADYEPFAPVKSKAAASTLYIGFLANELDEDAKAKLLSAESKVDEFHFHQRELYWRCHVRLSDSKFSGSRLEKMLGARVTFRNANTIQRLAAKYPVEPPAR